MAAKQGFSAHITQASEDARRAVISRAPTSIKSHSWLSNLNTTCTIKSAPPRTPEVMTLLANKSGWLVKRNEQQVWQRRWCCVVPHTFLYYFEAEPVREGEEEDYGTREGFSGGGVYRSGAVVDNQDLLNAAVRDGCKSKSSKETTPLKGRDANALYSPTSGEKMTPAPVRGPTTTNGNLSPAGIIDLECYSCVNRSTRHELVFELTGDEITNPDLRSFYFQAGSVEDCEAWTNALLSDRHSALRDEREAYRQVCDSFQLQLQNLSDMIDEAEAKTAKTENQLYNVRSGAEKFRTQIVTIVREALEQKCWESGQTDKEKKELSSEMEKLDQHLEKSRLFYMDQIDEVMSSENIGTTKNTGALITQILADYLTTVIGSYTEMGVKVKSMEQKLNRSAGVDKATVTDLKRKIEKLEEEKDEKSHKYASHIATLTAQINEMQKNNEELENQLETQRVEFSMFQSQARSKLQELSSHKKILKREVIDLRKKIDEVGSERDAALHITDSHKVQAESEKEKNAMLEKYIEKMENQVVVQQNMMEMISLSGMSQIDDGGGGGGGGNAARSNSVVGRIIGAPDDGSLSSFGPRHFRTLSNSNNLREPSPYKLPPRSGVPSDHPPMSPVRRKRRDDNSTYSSSKRRGSKKRQHLPFSDAKTQSTPRRGTLDHQLIDNVDEDEKKSSTHDERVTRYQQALEKGNTLNISKNTDSTDNEVDDENDDNKSNVSELTEDRTQRAFDSKLHERQATIQYTMSDMTGENVVDGIPEKKSKLSKQSEEGQNNFPPRFIIGAPKDVSDQPGTIISPRNTDESFTQGTKLSVAQRARLAAEQNGEGNKVNVTAEAETIRLNEAKERKPQLQTPPRTRSQSPGVFSNLASMIAKRSEASKAQKDTKSGGNGEVTLTLVERQKQQRERQLRVLRENGILRDGDSTISGGAGAQSIRSGSTQRSR